MDRQRFATGGLPSLSEDVTERSRRCAIHKRHHLVARQMMHEVRQQAPGLLMQVVVRVPSSRHDVAPAAEGEGVVDDRQLLMVARAERNRAVQLKADPGSSEPAPCPLRVAAMGC
ncbi:hypothetical protein [Phenylobacterium sp. J367]|uniref:hypothetical protein n=1 Tax=Phenylobacterium sp. J367 TaxID=2898435 RepID=UPI002150C1C3|nr:hypothetical protein [Phenylobacterium sp. J367]MCR5881255.1 hypothetical protein [Phenylobacterium sp. J367]